MKKGFHPDVLAALSDPHSDVTWAAGMHGGRRSCRSIYQRLMDGVVKDSEHGSCWVVSTQPSQTYPGMSVKDRRVSRARVMFYITNGREAQVVRHTCDNPRCINPDHLIDGSNWDNTQDMIRRGRAKFPSKQEFCKRGHLLKDPNLYYSARGRRQCKECAIGRARRSRKKVFG